MYGKIGKRIPANKGMAICYLGKHFTLKPGDSTVIGDLALSQQLMAGQPSVPLANAKPAEKELSKNGIKALGVFAMKFSHFGLKIDIVKEDGESCTVMLTTVPKNQGVTIHNGAHGAATVPRGTHGTTSNLFPLSPANREYAEYLAQVALEKNKEMQTTDLARAIYFVR
jgi:hypothetical protein